MQASFHLPLTIQRFFKIQQGRSTFNFTGKIRSSASIQHGKHRLAGPNLDNLSPCSRANIHIKIAQKLPPANPHTNKFQSKTETNNNKIIRKAQLLLPLPLATNSRLQPRPQITCLLSFLSSLTSTLSKKYRHANKDNTQTKYNYSPPATAVSLKPHNNSNIIKNSNVREEVVCVLPPQIHNQEKGTKKTKQYNTKQNKTLPPPPPQQGAGTRSFREWKKVPARGIKFGK